MKQIINNVGDFLSAAWNGNYRTKKGWVSYGSKRYYVKSGWENNYFWYMVWLRKNKHIADFEYEPDIFWFEGIRRGVTNYKPDFKIFNNDGSIEYHEVKGYMDSKSKTKIKRMAKYHPDVKLIVIDGAAYRALAKQVGKLVKGWT